MYVIQERKNLSKSIKFDAYRLATWELTSQCADSFQSTLQVQIDSDI